MPGRILHFTLSHLVLNDQARVLGYNGLGHSSLMSAQCLLLVQQAEIIEALLLNWKLWTEG